MTYKRVTISVPAEVAAKAQRAVDAGYSESVSAYFVHLAEQEPDWVTGRAAVDVMIEEAGGLTEEDRQWAREMIYGAQEHSEGAA